MQLFTIIIFFVFILFPTEMSGVHDFNTRTLPMKIRIRHTCIFQIQCIDEIFIAKNINPEYSTRASNQSLIYR